MKINQHEKHSHHCSCGHDHEHEADKSQNKLKYKDFEFDDNTDHSCDLDPTKICDNCIRFAPIYINGQQYGSIHGLNENVNQGALPKAVDFYKTVIKKAYSRL